MSDTSAFVAKPGDEVAADDMAPVNSLELVRIQPLFQRRNCLVQQVTPSASKQPHVIAFSLDPFDIDCCEADQLGAV